MIRHLLFITFTEAASAVQVDAVRRAFLDMPRRVTGVIRVEWGMNDSPEGKNAGYTHCVLMTFTGEAARRRYLPHPAHAALKTMLSPLLREIIVLDFTLTPENSTAV
ncbi:Dabb family protein [Enterobacter ludwigii]|uniref:Dabb family protein n=1 Tax=Enterobacter ludwigii TaxID=299767 RepID=UPI003BEECE92